MKYFSLIAIGLLFIYFMFSIYKQISNDKKLIWQHLKFPLMGILFALLLIDSIYNRP